MSEPEQPAGRADVQPLSVSASPELVEAADTCVELLRSVSNRWRQRAEGGALSSPQARAEALQLIAGLEAAGALIHTQVRQIAPPPPVVERSSKGATLSALLIDSIADFGLFVTDQEGLILSWNPGAERLTGYRTEQVIGQNFRMLYPPDDAASGQPEHDQSAAGRDGRFSTEAWRVRADGRRFWASTTISQLRDPNGKLRGFSHVLRDSTETQRSLDLLRRSEERMRLMVEAVRDYAIFMLDPDGRIISWNAGARRLKGYEANEVIGHHFSVFYPEDAQKIGHPAAELRLAKTNGRYEEEGWRVRKDGTRFWANVVITAVFDPERRHLGFTKVTRDFTERREAEERLRQSEERFRLMVASVRDYAIFMLDPQGRIASWNAGAQNLKGYSADEVLGRHFSMMYTEPDRRRNHPQEELVAALRDGTYAEEGWRVRKDGTLMWASVTITTMRDAHGNHIGFAKVTRDMTERREHDELLRQSEERLRLLVESVKDFAIFMLDPEGRIVSWNSGAEQINGYKAPEVLGKHFSIFYPAEDIAAGRPRREIELAIRDGRYEEEGWRLRRGGQRYWVNVVLTAVYDGEKRLRGFAKVTRDLTVQRQAAEEKRVAELRALEETARAVEAHNAVKLRDEFISIAAHELRTPLAALHLKIHGVSQALQRGGKIPIEKLTERMQSASRQVDRMGDLVERLLDVSRIVAGRLELVPEETDLVAIAQQTVDDFRLPAAESGSDLAIHAEPSVRGIWDRARLEQVLVNLVSNAIKYGDRKPIDLRISNTDDGAQVVVTDRGIGITQEDLGRIFARFERAVPLRNYGGLGLGLYITRNIVEAHGGTIRVKSTPGNGTRFTVELPRVTPVQDNAKTALPGAASHPSEGTT